MTRLKISLISILFLGLVSLLLSQNATPQSQLFFGLKRIQEKKFLILKSSPLEKAKYQSQLLDRRLYDLQQLVKNKNYTYILNASLRYSTTAGELTQLIKDNKLVDLTKRTQEKFNQHLRLLENLYDSYPKDVNGEYKFIQDDINYLKIYLTQLMF